MLCLKDQLGRTVELKHSAQRIVSVVPSLTELLFDLGLSDKVVGRTKFCIHPESGVSQVSKVGGTKNLDISKIVKLNADLVIANKEENLPEQIEQIAQHIPVFVTDINNIATAIDAIEKIGILTNTTAKANEMSLLIKNNWCNKPLNDKNTIKVCYLIWKKPLMTVGGDTFINEVLSLSGFTNIYAHKSRYPIIEMQDIIEKQPDYIFLSSEPYPFKEKDLAAFQSLLPDSKIKVKLVDGEMFSWYGSHLLKASTYMQELKASLR